MLEKFMEFFTPARRRAIYGIVAASATVLLAFNVITTAQLNSVTETVIRIITALTAFMAFFNTSTQTKSGLPPADSES
jgi:hypothetical protein